MRHSASPTPWSPCSIISQWDLYCLGYPDQARSRSEAAVEEARKLRHAYSLAHALTMACFVDWAARSRDELLARADDAGRGLGRARLFL